MYPVLFFFSFFLRREKQGTASSLIRDEEESGTFDFRPRFNFPPAATRAGIGRDHAAIVSPRDDPTTPSMFESNFPFFETNRSND